MNNKIIALACVITPLILLGMSGATALSVASVVVDANNQPLTTPSGTPSIVSVSADSFIHGKIETIGDPTQVDSSLTNFVWQEKHNADTTTIEFDGITQNSTTTINLIQDGMTAYSLVFTPTSEVKPIIHDPSVIDYTKTVPEWVYAVVPVMIVGIIIVVWKKKTSGSIIL